MNTQTYIAQSTDDLENFAASVKNKSKFTIEPVKLSEQQQWLVKSDCLSHKSGGFFSLCGYCDDDLEALVLFQPQGAFNGMAIYCEAGRVYLLLQARVEPGNSCLVQYGPTVQSTPANYLRLHGGKKTAYLEFFFEYYPGVKVLENSTQLDLGRRYYQKTKILSYVQLDEMCPCAENMIWVPLDVLAKTVGNDNFLNTDLRSMLGVFDWDSLMGKSPIADVASNLTLPLKRQPRSSGNLVSLKELSKWKLTDKGIEATGDVATSAKLYEVTCTNREVAQWVQPLYLCEGTGSIVLYQRSNNGSPEFLLQRGKEFGISGSDVYLPSEIVDPSEDRQIDVLEGEVLVDLLQSEEGGRFLENENRYRLIKVQPNVEISHDRVWVSVAEFKTILATSNMVSIQLRAIASLVLPNLNPSLLGQTKSTVSIS